MTAIRERFDRWLGTSGNPTTWRILARLVRERARAYAPRYALAFVLMALVAGCTALSAYMMKDVINLIFVERDREALVWIPLAILALFTVKGFAAYFQEVTLARIGNRIVADTQSRLFDHILKMDMAFFQRFPSNDLITRISANAAAARTMLDIAAVGLGRDLLTIVSLTVVMFWQDPLMASVCLLVGPFAVTGLRRLMKRVKKVAEREVLSTSKVVGAMRETSQGIRVVKAFQMEDALRARMADGISAVERRNNKIVRIRALINPMIDALGGFVVAGVVFYAGWRNLTQGATPGEFFSFVTALLMMSDPARKLSRLQIQLAAASVGVRMMYDILDAPAAEAEDIQKPDLAIQGGEVRLDGVTFEYEPGVPVLREANLLAAAGKTTAMVGLSGSGKSTIFALIQGLRRPEGGRVLVDGQSAAEVSLASLRRNIALVGQDVFLFEGSIRDNIRAGRATASDEEVEAAARIAQADGFIRRFANGYDTPVGELGSQLAGGERQRISIARAVLKDAPIVLLDEPTSALDSETERLIQGALAELTKGKTTLVIAHRLSTVANADMIHVLQAGHVVQSGTHADLVRRPGLYAKLYRLQFADPRAAGDEEEPEITPIAGSGA